jgi:hypothetical protein
MLAIPFTCLCITFYHRWILSTEQAHQDEPSPLEVQSGDEEHGAQDHLEKTNDDTKDLN